MNSLDETERLLVLMSTGIGFEMDAERVIHTTKPVSHFIDWLDEPDQVLDADQGMLYIWDPVRFYRDTPPATVAVIDCGSFRGVFVGAGMRPGAQPALR